MKGVNNSEKIGLQLNFPGDGAPLEYNSTYYWSDNFKNIVLHHSDRFFPEVSLPLSSDGECNEVLFYKNDDKGRELAAQSVSLRDGVKLTRRDVKRLQKVIDHLHEVALSPDCSQVNSGFLKNFRLPDPAVMPEAWRVSGNRRQLILLWGYTNQAANATFLPASAVSGDWPDAADRKDIATLLKPYTSSFEIPWRIIILILLILLLIGGCRACSKGKGDKGDKKNQESGEVQTENGNDVNGVEEAKSGDGPQGTSDGKDSTPQQENSASNNGALQMNAGDTAKVDNGTAPQKKSVDTSENVSDTVDASAKNSGDNRQNVAKGANEDSRKSTSTVESKKTTQETSKDDGKGIKDGAIASSESTKSSTTSEKNIVTQSEGGNGGSVQKGTESSKTTKKNVVKQSDDRSWWPEWLRKLFGKKDPKTVDRKTREEAIKTIDERVKNGEATPEEREFQQQLLDDSIHEDEKTLAEQRAADSEAAEKAAKEIAQHEQSVQEAAEDVKKDNSVPDEIRNGVQDDPSGAQKAIGERIGKGKATETERKWYDAQTRKERVKKTAQEEGAKREGVMNTLMERLGLNRSKQNGGVQDCDECHSTSARIGCKVLKFEQKPDDFCEVTLQFTPECQKIQNLQVTYLKIGYLFKRDFNWNASARTVTFKLKKNELNNDSQRLVMTLGYDHAGASQNVDFRLKLTVNSTQQTTVQGIELSR